MSPEKSRLDYLASPELVDILTRFMLGGRSPQQVEEGTIHPMDPTADRTSYISEQPPPRDLLGSAMERGNPLAWMEQIEEPEGTPPPSLVETLARKVPQLAEQVAIMAGAAKGVKGGQPRMQWEPRFGAEKPRPASSDRKPMKPLPKAIWNEKGTRIINLAEIEAAANERPDAGPVARPDLHEIRPDITDRAGNVIRPVESDVQSLDFAKPPSGKYVPPEEGGPTPEAVNSLEQFDQFVRAYSDFNKFTPEHANKVLDKPPVEPSPELVSALVPKASGGQAAPSAPKPKAILIPASIEGKTVDYTWETPGGKALSKPFTTEAEALANRPEGFEHLNMGYQPFKSDIASVTPRATPPKLEVVRGSGLPEEVVLRFEATDQPLSLAEVNSMFPDATIQRMGSDMVLDSPGSQKFRLRFNTPEEAAKARAAFGENVPIRDIGGSDRPVAPEPKQIAPSQELIDALMEFKNLSPEQFDKAVNSVEVVEPSATNLPINASAESGSGGSVEAINRRARMGRTRYVIVDRAGNVRPSTEDSPRLSPNEAWGEMDAAGNFRPLEGNMSIKAPKK